MKQWECKDLLFVAEYVPFIPDNVEDKAEAKKFLSDWRTYLMRKHLDTLFNYELIEEDWTEREALYSGPFAVYATLSLRLAFKRKLDGQL